MIALASWTVTWCDVVVKAGSHGLERAGLSNLPKI